MQPRMEQWLLEQDKDCHWGVSPARVATESL